MFLFFCGCKKKEKVFLDRANDTAYIASLYDQHEIQKTVAMRRMETSRQMTQCVMRVRSALPQGSGGDEALADALAADAEWQRLEALAQEQDEEAVRVWEDARMLMQRRILAEAQAARDVEAGKAVAMDRKAVEEKRARLIAEGKAPQ
ncbi:MAG: hypothetical protein FWG50_06340 [Kiritimatiellaeota bacterium]|nr:hypothetical protein [Kiritimatiellota bacterium]